MNPRPLLVALLLGACTPQPASVVPSPTPPPDDTPWRGTGPLLAPPEITDEPVWCWTVRELDGDSELIAVGLPAGTTYVWGDVQYGSAPDFDYLDGRLVWANNDRIHGLDLETRERSFIDVTGADLGIRGLAVNDGAINATMPDGFLAFDDWDAVVDDDSTRFEWGLGNTTTRGSRVDFEDGLGFGAWHSTDVIEQFSPATGFVEREIRLEDYDGWIHGLEVENDLIHTIGTTAGLTRAIFQYDLDGRQVSVTEVDSDYIYGLWCDTTQD